jgi:hypothetical protein
MRDTWREQRRRLVSALADVISQGISGGVVRDDIPLEVLAVFLLGMLRTEGRENERNPGSSASLECVLELFLNGCRAARGVRVSGDSVSTYSNEGECDREM